MSGTPGVNVAPALRPASGKYEVGDVLILAHPGMRPREFRVTAVNEAATNSVNYTMIPVDGDAYWGREPLGYVALEVEDAGQ